MRSLTQSWGKAPAQTSGLIGRKWKHREVLELTGTNRPRTCHTPHPLAGRGGTPWRAETDLMSRPLCGSERTTTVRFPTGGVITCSQRYGGHGERETPGSIPNPEAKPLSADGTAPETGWESRTPPDNHSPKGPPTRWGPSPSPPPGPLCTKVPRPGQRRRISLV